MTVEPRGSQDYERRSVWLALAVALAVVFRSPVFVGFGNRDFQIWAYVATLLALGLSLCLCFLLIVPELRGRLGPRLREERPAFAWAVGLFILGMLITIMAFVEGAIESLDEDSSPFG